jgi:hypothetical protein
VVTTGGGGAAEVTVTLELPDFPAHVAVIVAVPVPTPVTTPLPSTIATAALLVDQEIFRPVMTLPCASFTIADRVTAALMAIDADAGATVTVVTTGGWAVVDPRATFEGLPNTASPFSAPRKAVT